MGNWTNSGPKGQAWIRPDGVAESERKDLLLYRDHVAKGLQLKAGDRVEYGVHNRPTSQGRSVAVKVTKLDASMLRRAPVRNAGAKVEDAGIPLAQRQQPQRDDGLQRALAASRADFDAEEQKRLAEREDEELAKALMLSAAAASEDDRRRREQEAAEASQREQEAAEASRRMAEMAAAKQEAKEIAAKIESAFGDEGAFIGARRSPSTRSPTAPHSHTAPRDALLGQGGLYIRTKLP